MGTKPKTNYQDQYLNWYLSNSKQKFPFSSITKLNQKNFITNSKFQTVISKSKL